MIKFIIFDMAGVILESGTTYAITQIASLLSLPESAVKNFLAENSIYGGKYRQGGMTAAQFWTQALTTWKKQYDWQELNNIWINSFALKRDIWAIVTKLHEKGYVLGIISNTVKDRYAHIKSQIPVDKYFHSTVLSFLDHVLKPDPQAFKLILQKLKITDPQTAVYIDDKEIHTQVAESLGMKSIVCKNAPQLTASLLTLGIEV